MRYPASDKLQVIRLVEKSHLPVRRTLEKLGIQPSRFHRWYDRPQTGGPEALEDKSPNPRRVWNRSPNVVRERIVQLALDKLELSPRDLATRFTDTAGYFVWGDRNSRPPIGGTIARKRSQVCPAGRRLQACVARRPPGGCHICPSPADEFRRPQQPC